MFFNLTSVWANILLTKYRARGCPTIKGSKTWNNITNCWNLYRDTLFGAIKDGTKVRSWEDRWIPSMPSLSSIVKGPITNPPSPIMVKDIWRERAWDITILPFQIPPNIIHNIRNAFHQSSHLENDIPLWRLTGDGTFSCKSACHFIFNLKKGPYISHTSYRWIWHLNVPNKIKTSMWLLHHNSLPTKATLSKRGLNLPTSCHIFTDQLEDQHHIFFGCVHAKTLWKTLIQRYRGNRNLQFSMFDPNN